MLLASIEQDSVEVKFVSFNKLPVELITQHQGASVNIREQESSSGV